MWPRYLAMLTGAWLIFSPWLFGHANGSWLHWNDIGCGVATIVLAALSFARATRWAHLGIGGVAVWLAASAYFAFERPGPPGAQNEITIGLVLLLLFSLPNEASLPPEPWRNPGAE